MGSRLFVNPSCLLEGKTESLSGLQITESLRLKKRLQSHIDAKESAVIAMIGRFGSGKTTVLNSIESELNTVYTWINFDVWRYADRQQIWDGFVIEVAAKMGGKSEDEAADIIEGNSGWKSWVLSHKIISAILAVFAWTVLSYPIWLLGNMFPYPEALLKYGVGVIFSVLVLLGISTIFPEQKPLKRIFQLEDYLLKTVNSSDKPVVIVVEDVDRAGPEGLVFMETVKRFFTNHKLNIPVVIIAPQSKAHFKIHEKGTLEGFERGVKIYDTILYFSASKLTPEEAIGLVRKAKLSKKYTSEEENFEATVNILLRFYSTYVSMRTFKFILREVDEFTSAHVELNPSVTLCLIFSRCVLLSSNQSGKFDEGSSVFEKNGQISNISEPGADGLMRAIAQAAGTSKGEVFTNIEYVDMKEDVLAIRNHSATTIKLNSTYKELFG